MIFRGLGNSVQKVLFKAFLHSGKEAIEYHSVKSVGAYHDMKAKSSEGVQRLRLEHCISLFEAYLCGYGVNKDPVEGLKWLLRAAKCGLPDAAGDLQNCYEALGLDFRPDDEVKMMLVYSALHGHPGAKEIVRRFDLFQSLQGRELNEWVLEFDLHNVSFPGKVARIAFYNSKLFQRQLRTYLRQPQSQLRDLLLTSQGDNLLQSCILADADLEVIRMVLESGIDVNVANKYGETALLQACRAGNSNIVNTLLKVGADAKAIDSRGCSPLHYICTMTLPEKDFLRLTRILVQGGADIHKMSQEPICLHLEKCLGSPLHFAVLLNNLNAVKAYVSFGAIATLTSVSQFLCSAVEFAASLLYYDILVYLVERTPNLNFDTFFVK
ncbi:MAG: hypothetical protein LQ342_002464 [Letrouitia transgressa]|nr:MAG: hypothetical protein LQ342_002464 [Letrouitia transgressa]